MDTPRSVSGEVGKKTRATSCTNCRQVKLKCDLRERYPNPCSRCTTHHSECKTDASFKRVPARSRIRDLENQINQLKRNRALEQATPWPSTESVPDIPHRSPSSNYLDDYISNQPLSDGLSYDSPSDFEVSRGDVKWLNITDTDVPTPFILGDVSLPYTHALELFLHFENHYLTHFCIIQPINSLRHLHAESQLLFWSITVIASRRHSQHGSYFERLRSSLNTLLGQVIAQSIESLLDLQAILLMCAFRCNVVEEPHDPGLGHLGFAVDAARQMGLDKSQDDPISSWGIPFNKYPRHVKQMTWLKCFELDVQMSCWHGLLPSLATPYNLRTTMGFCDTLPMFFDYAAVVSIHVELAASLLALDEALSGGSQSPAHIVHLFNERLGALKAKWAPSWSLDAQLVLLTARLYMYSSCFASTESVISRMNNDGFSVDVLQAAHTPAVQLITLQANLNAECVGNLASSGFNSDTTPLTGRPRHVRRTVFFAACLLLRYLDEPGRSANDEHETARNAFTKAYQMFTSFAGATNTEDLNVSRTLEAVGRIVGQGQRALQPHVTTRMAASIRHNIVWLATELGRYDQEATSESVSSSLEGPSSHPTVSVIQPVPLDPFLNPVTTTVSDTVLFGDSMWDPTAITLPPHLNLPYNAWDDAAFDNWQGPLSYPLSTGMEFDALHQATTMA